MLYVCFGSADKHFVPVSLQVFDVSCGGGVCFAAAVGIGGVIVDDVNGGNVVCVVGVVALFLGVVIGVVRVPW